jgi:Uncharacterized alpha/beta hydrolase domain (DUF2235)
MTRKRRLILLLDGTWNDVETSDRDTNIVRLRDILAQSLSATFNTPISVEEVVAKDDPTVELGIRSSGDFDYMFFYQRGVGTGPGLDRLTGGALGWGLGQNIRRAYKFLSRNYQPGAEIFVFGFSRGAFTARSLVGYLGSSGLLKEEHCDTKLEQTAWSHYRTRPDDRMPSFRKSVEPYVHPFGEVRVACLGVFETVGSLGIPTTVVRRLNREFYEFHDVELSPIVRVNLHALAVDERRRPFAASVWRQSRFRWSNSVTEQTWFSGVHSDVGGGLNSVEDRRKAARDLDDVTLDWMIKRVRYHYPDFPVSEIAFPPLQGVREYGVQHDSMTWQYRMAGLGLRAIGNTRPATKWMEKVVSYDRSERVVGESVHISAIERLGRLVEIEGSSDKVVYAPANLREVLPDLYARYCRQQARSWAPEALSLTVWSGEIVHESRSDDATKATADRAVRDAVGRLRKNGIDVRVDEDGGAMLRAIAPSGAPEAPGIRETSEGKAED